MILCTVIIIFLAGVVREKLEKVPKIRMALNVLPVQNSYVCWSSLHYLHCTELL